MLEVGGDGVDRRLHPGNTHCTCQQARIELAVECGDGGSVVVLGGGGC